MTSSDIVDQWVGSHDLPEWFTKVMAVPREEGFAEINGQKVHYFRWGTRGNPPLLITHGFLAHSRCFAFIAPFFAEKYDIVAFDLAGMGGSDLLPGLTNAERGEDMVAAAEQFNMFDGPIKPIIIAHSFGAGVGLSAMEYAGERFAGLVICDLMVMRPEKLMAIWEAEGLARPASSDPSKRNKVYPDYETARGRYVLSPPQAVRTPFLMDYMAYHSLHEVDGGWTWKFDPQVFTRNEDDQQSWLKTGQRIADLKHKIVIIYGQKSALFDSDSIDYIKELGGSHIPLIEVPDAEHHLMLDQPLAFVTGLRSALALW
jgi:pimeloyl-ACP methyl ester carboxylesterase